MNKLFATLVALFVLTLSATSVRADDDRFGSERFEVPRTSFTDSADFNVLIASAPALYENTGGEIYLKAVNCTGATAGIITFYDTVTWELTTSTRTRIEHIANNVTSIPYGILFSSGLMYNKTAATPCVISWDFSTPPKGAKRQY